jgi:aminodeoxyfutalosine synthase
MRNNELDDIKEKVLTGIRLDKEDGLRLMESHDIITLGYLADIVRQRKVGDNAYFNSNLNINFTNICISRCPLCAFSKDMDTGYLLSLEEIEHKVRSSISAGIREVHIVGGLHPEVPFSYFEDMLKMIKNIDKDIFIQAFTAVEIDHFARISRLSLDEVLYRLKAAGLDSIPGGGAEIFSERVRNIIAPKKISGKQWLKVMEIAHGMGIRSNATMLYGHVETMEERIEHMLILRELQDKTGGFLAFVPLAFHPQNTRLAYCKGTDGFDDLKVFAVARILLDNFDHIKGLWMYLGEKLAEVAMCFGVDDLGGIGLEEKIVHAAGAMTPQQISKDTLVRMIRNAGRIPKEVNSIYQEIR